MTSYDVEYLPLAQRVMGDMFDYAVNTLNYSLSKFYMQFIVSGIDKQIEIGNPTYVAGHNGCELARLVLEKTEQKIIDTEDLMYVDKSPEYWFGWSIAYYQWETLTSFREVSEFISIDEICEMYYPLHEADISKFVAILNEKKEKANISKLARLRKYAQLTQKLLSEKSGVPLRQIQLFEQEQRDIHKTQADTLIALSKALSCHPSDLL